MEDKVKDQLEAANPEPIIEEVVSKQDIHSNIIFVVVILKSLLSFLSHRIWQTWLQGNLTGETISKIFLVLKYVDMDNVNVLSWLY